MDVRSPIDERPPEEFATHAEALRALARALIGSANEAEDLVQDTWLAWLRTPPLDRASAGAWLKRVLSNRAVSLRRAQVRREAREREAARPERLHEELQLERDEALRRVVAAVLSLEPMSKDVVWRRYFEDHSVERIALELRLSPRAVYERLARAHTALRRALARDFGDEQRALRGLALLAGVRSDAALVTGGAVLGPAAWIAAAALVIGAIAWLASRPMRSEPAFAQADERIESTRAIDSEAVADAADRPPAVARAEVEASDVVVETSPRWAPPSFEYELDVQVFDWHELPVGAVYVFASPAGRALNAVGATDRDGRMQMRFRAFTATVELDLATSARGLRERVSLPRGRSAVALRGAPLGMLKIDREGSVHSGTFFTMAIASGDGSIRLRAGTPEIFESVVSGASNSMTFVEPWLIESRELRALHLSRSKVDRLRAPSIELRNRATEQAGAGAAVRGRVFDDRGAPAPNARAHIRHESEVLWTSLQLDGEGEFLARGLTAGRWELRVRADGLGSASEDFVLAQGEERQCELRLDPGRVFCARLLDETGAPCAEWRVELRKLDGFRVDVDTAVTDSDGRVRIANAPSGPLRVLARPERVSMRPAVVVAEGARANGAESTLRVPLAASQALAPLRLELTPAHAPGPSDCAARARRIDGSQLAQLDFSGSETVMDGEIASWQRWMLALDELIPGPYEIEVQAPARGVITLSPIELAAGTEREIEALAAFDLPARLQIEARPTRSGGAREVRLRKRGEQFELLSTPFDVARGVELLIEPGDYELVTASGLARWADLSLGAGEVGVVFADGRVERLSPSR